MYLLLPSSNPGSLFLCIFLHIPSCPLWRAKSFLAWIFSLCLRVRLKSFSCISVNNKCTLCVFFPTERYEFSVKEDEPAGFNIGRLDINDRDEKQNKNATFTIDQSQTETFDVKLNDNNDGVLILKKVAFPSSCPRHTTAKCTSQI